MPQRGCINLSPDHCHDTDVCFDGMGWMLPKQLIRMKKTEAAKYEKERAARNATAKSAAPPARKAPKPKPTVLWSIMTRSATRTR